MTKKLWGTTFIIDNAEARYDEKTGLYRQAKQKHTTREVPPGYITRTIRRLELFEDCRLTTFDDIMHAYTRHRNILVKNQRKHMDLWIERQSC